MKRSIGFAFAVLFFAMSASSAFCWDRWHHEGIIGHTIRDIGWGVREALGLAPRTYVVPGYGMPAYSAPVIASPMYSAPVYVPRVVSRPMIMPARPMVMRGGGRRR